MYINLFYYIEFRFILCNFIISVSINKDIIITFLIFLDSWVLLITPNFFSKKLLFIPYSIQNSLSDLFPWYSYLQIYGYRDCQTVTTSLRVRSVLTRSRNRTQARTTRTSIAQKFLYIRISLFLSLFFIFLFDFFLISFYVQ